MWWCCGRTGEDALGCRFGKHECKEDDDIEDLYQQNEESKQNKNKKIKCYCCKEVGHLTSDCLRDPNIKTFKDVEVEVERI